LSPSGSGFFKVSRDNYQNAILGLYDSSGFSRVNLMGQANSGSLDLIGGSQTLSTKVHLNAGSFSYFNQNVSIGGTSYPTDALDVNGDLNVMGALKVGQICISNDCRVGWPTGGTSQWISGTGGIYYNLGNVGLGLSNPATRIQIFNVNSDTNSFRIDSNSWFKSVAFLIDKNGNVGIGTRSPATLLDTAGTIRSTSQTIPTSGAGLELFYTGDQGYLTSFDRTNSQYKPLFINGSTLALNANSGGKVGINTSNPTAKLQIVGTGDTRGQLGFGDGSGEGYLAAGSSAIVLSNSAGTPLMTVLQGGNVGIGTTTPQTQFQVAGEARLGGISSDGIGKVACVKSNGDLGTCSTAPNSSGVCTCV
jgi:hypothetical protein